mmetsp:Transcript_11901/g.30075  ORF Transcript_11901/g.30075 Transcript_11901/m.30075 type:complete len:307 (+) Transcript_11901:472-1392(+)
MGWCVPIHMLSCCGRYSRLPTMPMLASVMLPMVSVSFSLTLKERASMIYTIRLKQPAHTYGPTISSTLAFRPFSSFFRRMRFTSQMRTDLSDDDVHTYELYRIMDVTALSCAWKQFTCTSDTGSHTVMMPDPSPHHTWLVTWSEIMHTTRSMHWMDPLQMDGSGVPVMSSSRRGPRGMTELLTTNREMRRLSLSSFFFSSAGCSGRAGSAASAMATSCRCGKWACMMAPKLSRISTNEGRSASLSAHARRTRALISGSMSSGRAGRSPRMTISSSTDMNLMSEKYTRRVMVSYSVTAYEYTSALAV